MHNVERIIVWSNGSEIKEQRTRWNQKDRKAATAEEQKFIDCGFTATEIKFEKAGRKPATVRSQQRQMFDAYLAETGTRHPWDKRAMGR